jgi:pimeloyl-ACP methyl ester carboxylesterase
MRVTIRPYGQGVAVPSSRRPHPARGAAIVAAVFAGLVVPGAPAGAGARRFDVGGFRLNLRCEGEGSPAVVLDAGAGDTLATWEWVTPGVRKLTRICVYDRAGLGKSDPGPKPRTSTRIVAELHELLSRARVPPPYVLVGHSFGGLNARLFASRFPDEVSGLVLVDATPEDYPEIEDTLHSRGEREKLKTSRAIAPQAFADELDAMTESAASIRAAPVPPRLPVVILTAVHRDDSPEFRATWTTLQRRMAGAFPNGRQVIAEHSDHYIQFDEPELVISAIREIVASARGPDASKGRRSGP